MLTNTFRYTTYCAANVYMFVYILIGAPIVPLTAIVIYSSVYCLLATPLRSLYTGVTVHNIITRLLIADLFRV